jgi:hypothetical protein
VKLLIKEVQVGDKKMIEVPEDVMKGLYRIMCSIPSSMSGMEVYHGAIDGMKNAQQWVLKYGEKNNIDSRGFDETQV